MHPLILRLEPAPTHAAACLDCSGRSQAVTAPLSRPASRPCPTVRLRRRTRAARAPRSRGCRPSPRASRPRETPGQTQRGSHDPRAHVTLPGCHRRRFRHRSCSGSGWPRHPYHYRRGGSSPVPDFPGYGSSGGGGRLPFQMLGEMGWACHQQWKQRSGDQPCFPNCKAYEVAQRPSAWHAGALCGVFGSARPHASATPSALAAGEQIMASTIASRPEPTREKRGLKMVSRGAGPTASSLRRPTRKATVAWLRKKSFRAAVKVSLLPHGCWEERHTAVESKPASKATATRRNAMPCCVKKRATTDYYITRSLTPRCVETILSNARHRPCEARRPTRCAPVQGFLCRRRGGTFGGFWQDAAPLPVLPHPAGCARRGPRGVASAGASSRQRGPASRAGTRCGTSAYRGSGTETSLNLSSQTTH